MNQMYIERFKAASIPKEADIISQWEGDKRSPVISIVCIAYNHELHIHDAIKGFLIQETTYPFEVIIHDDCSSDETKKIIEYYQKKYPSIINPIYQTVNQFSIEPNRIISIPLASASGEYIAICEGDDFWMEPSKLQQQVSFLQENPDYTMCIHNALIVNHYENRQYLFNTKEIPSTINIKDVICRGWFTPTASFLFKNDDLNIPLDKDINGDMLMLFLNANKGKVFYSPEVMSIYNYGTTGSLSHLTKKNKSALYQKKWNFLKYVNQETHSRFFLLVAFVFMKTKIGCFLNKFGLR